MVKKTITTYIYISLFFAFELNAQSYTTYDYYNTLFKSEYKTTLKILSSFKKKSHNSLITKQLYADFYYIMYETTGDLEIYNTLCKQNADYVNRVLTKKEKLNDDEVATIISAKSIILKIQFKKKNYLKVAKEFQSIIKYLKYALAHENVPKLKLVAGMYNYYIELAKEDYPALYPVLIFFPSGDKKKGLRLLKECSHENDIYVQTRASLFLANIYRSDEKDFEKAKYWFQKLLKKHSSNVLWQREYIFTLREFKKEKEAIIQKDILLKNIKQNTHLTKKQIEYFKKI